MIVTYAYDKNNNLVGQESGVAARMLEADNVICLRVCWVVNGNRMPYYIRKMATAPGWLLLKAKGLPGQIREVRSYSDADVPIMIEVCTVLNNEWWEDELDRRAAQKNFTGVNIPVTQKA